MHVRALRPIPSCAALLALGAAGCAASPGVEAVSARQVSPTAEGTSVRVLLELRNPNDAPLELTTWNYTLVVDDRPAYSGEWVASLTLPPGEPMRAEIPAFLPASFGDVTGARWRIGGQIGYRATGKLDKLLYQLGVTKLSAGFGAEGTGIAR